MHGYECPMLGIVDGGWCGLLKTNKNCYALANASSIFDHHILKFYFALQTKISIALFLLSV